MTLIHLGLLPPIADSHWWDDEDVQRYLFYIGHGSHPIDRLPHPCYNRRVEKDAGQAVEPVVKPEAANER